MTLLLVATEAGLAVAREAAAGWTLDLSLTRDSPYCVALDPADPGRAWCGTLKSGLWRTTDGGREWSRADAGIEHERAMAVAAARDGGRTVVWAGTEPSAVYRSDDGGDSWDARPGLGRLPSAGTWSFPPRPETHHVRWIEPDPVEPARLQVAIEAGAVVSTPDGGATWLDRTVDAPYDAHTIRAHPTARGLYRAACGDGLGRAEGGLAESDDGGRSWRWPAGPPDPYLTGLALDAGDPAFVLVSGSEGPTSSHAKRAAEARIWRREGGEWLQCEQGMPEAKGSRVATLVADPAAPGAFWAAFDRGVFQSDDRGESWRAIELPGWPDAHVHSLAVAV